MQLINSEKIKFYLDNEKKISKIFKIIKRIISQNRNLFEFI